MQQLSFGDMDQAVSQPLAARLRPDNLDDFAGQEHLVGPGMVLRRLIERDEISSMIFWGPPGVGKTTLAQIIANRTRSRFITFSAVTSGIKEIRKVMEQAEEGRRMGMRTILFVDEIHRFNKAQQDAFLPFVEKGSIILIGATTENPSFEVNAALLSRCRVFVLKALTAEDLFTLLKHALTSEKGFGKEYVVIAPDVLHLIANFANGDARMALSTLEMVVLNGEIKKLSALSEEEKDGCFGSARFQELSPDTPVIHVTDEIVAQCVSGKSLLYDKNGEEHYNLISALHKSMRNSDPDAAVYWLARMLEAGEDPLYIARRVVRFASEDVGLADPGALPQAVAAYQACHFIGMPECSVNLTQAVIYMAISPKSNAMDAAYIEASSDARERLAEPVPVIIRNGVTQLMRDLDYGKGYQYAHNYEDKLTSMQCLPDSLQGREYYRPTSQGREEAYAKRLAYIKEWKKEHRQDS